MGNLEPDQSQRAAINGIIGSPRKLIVMTGGPGVGKTFTVQHLLAEIWTGFDITAANTFLCAPTGKAAKVMEESIDVNGLMHKPSTIHRMLGCRGPTWEFTESEPLKAGLIIVDESSMVDTMLMDRLFRSTAPWTRFVLVGDKDQLPPVGAGCPFRDIVARDASGSVYRLTENHRQAEGSLISNACVLALSGKMPIFGSPGEKTLSGDRPDDLFFWEASDPEEITEAIKAKALGWQEEGIRDSCILIPQRTGKLGVDNMNLELQETLNPNDNDDHEMMGDLKVMLRISDRVLQTKNDYQLDVFNGYLGVVIDINPELKAMTVKFDDGQIVVYNQQQAFHLRLGYCMTIHKAQGSQFAHGLLLCCKAHSHMNSRQLFYTGLSRFKTQAIVLGQPSAISRSIFKNKEFTRKTFIDKKTYLLKKEAGLIANA